MRDTGVRRLGRQFGLAAGLGGRHPFNAIRPMSTLTDLELLMQNARLRDELEPFWDDSVMAVDLDGMPTDLENRYLSSLLAWERAPVLPIAQWFSPPLELATPENLSDEELAGRLAKVFQQLFEQNVLLESTGHLSDRQLYRLIMRDILPAQEKRISDPDAGIRWQCYDPVEDEETWLRYYATAGEREDWAAETGLKLPPREKLPFPRRMPQDRVSI